MKQTALQKAISKISTSDMAPYEILELLQGLLPEEKKIMSEFYDFGWVNGYHKKSYDEGEKMFEKTYGNEAD